MDFNFVLDDNFLAYQILKRRMHDESKEMSEVKRKISLNNPSGYKKLIGEEVLDSFSNLISNNLDARKLIDELIKTDKFMDLYEDYKDLSKDTFAIKILIGEIKEDVELIEIKDNLWDKYQDAYRSILNIGSSHISNLFLDDDVKGIIQEFKEMEIFKKMYRETEKYLDDVKKYWEENKDMINSFLKRVLRIEFAINPLVYITHPNANAGYSFEGNKIAWGHFRGVDDLNYNLTYLVHEGLHCLLPYASNATEEECDIVHSIIELISDYELYSLLKGESSFKEGHADILEYKKFIYPYWLRYIGLNANQISKRLREDGINIDVLNDEECEDLSMMNIHQFIKFCMEKYKASVISADKIIK